MSKPGAALTQAPCLPGTYGVSPRESLRAQRVEPLLCLGQRLRRLGARGLRVSGFRLGLLAISPQSRQLLLDLGDARGQLIQTASCRPGIPIRLLHRPHGALARLLGIAQGLLGPAGAAGRPPATAASRSTDPVGSRSRTRRPDATAAAASGSKKAAEMVCRTASSVASVTRAPCAVAREAASVASWLVSARRCRPSCDRVAASRSSCASRSSAASCSA